MIGWAISLVSLPKSANSSFGQIPRLVVISYPFISPLLSWLYPRFPVKISWNPNVRWSPYQAPYQELSSEILVSTGFFSGELHHFPHVRWISIVFLHDLSTVFHSVQSPVIYACWLRTGFCRFPVRCDVPKISRLAANPRTTRQPSCLALMICFPWIYDDLWMFHRLSHQFSFFSMDFSSSIFHSFHGFPMDFPMDFPLNFPCPAAYPVASATATAPPPLRCWAPPARRPGAVAAAAALGAAARPGGSGDIPSAIENDHL